MNRFTSDDDLRDSYDLMMGNIRRVRERGRRDAFKDMPFADAEDARALNESPLPPDAVWEPLPTSRVAQRASDTALCTACDARVEDPLGPLGGQMAAHGDTCPKGLDWTLLALGDGSYLWVKRNPSSAQAA